VKIALGGRRLIPDEIMVSAVISILIGAFCLFTRGWPIVLPVIGLALAVNAFVKGKKSAKPIPKNLGLASGILNAFVVGWLLIRIYL
jgi:hypothetical protein